MKGNLAGLGRGALNSAEGLTATAVLALRLTNPLMDKLISPPGQSATDQLGAAATGAAGYAAKGLRDPQAVIRGVRRKAEEMRVGLDPNASPKANSVSGEARRRFAIGMNQGEAFFDAASLLVGGPGAKTVGRFVGARTAARPAKYIAQGYPSNIAAYLAELYPSSGKGHHFMPQRLNLPSWFSESEFNVLKPPGISRGDMYELHAGADRYFNGAGTPRRIGGSWSAKKSGIKTRDLLGRIWVGSPAPLKARVGGLGAGFGGLAEDVQSREEGQ